jgi:putative membrane protein
VFLAVLAAAYIMPDRVFYRDLQAAAVFAAVLALLNMFVRPVLSFFALPLTCLTFGLFALIINGFTFWLAAQFVRDVGVASFFDAILAALIVSFVSALVSRLF